MRNMIAALRWSPIILVGFLLDQGSKWLILNHFRPGEVYPVFASFNLRLAYNKGVAFSLFNQGGELAFILTGITLLITIGLFVWLYRVAANEKITAFALSLILGGAIGNLLDRIRLGQVVDFLDFYLYQWHWPTFNLADTWICIGAFIIMINLFINPKQDDAL